jgi:hypothetical protein
LGGAVGRGRSDPVHRRRECQREPVRGWGGRGGGVGLRLLHGEGGVDEVFPGPPPFHNMASITLLLCTPEAPPPSALRCPPLHSFNAAGAASLWGRKGVGAGPINAKCPPCRRVLATDAATSRGSMEPRRRQPSSPSLFRDRPAPDSRGGLQRPR